MDRVLIRKSHYDAKDGWADTWRPNNLNSTGTKMKHLQRGRKTSACIYVQLSTVNGIDMGEHDRRDALLICYGVEPPYTSTPPLIRQIWGKISINHTLDCKMGGLVTTHHNRLRVGVSDLSIKDFTASHAQNDTLIYTDNKIQGVRT